jgi:hypothetical protein
MKSILLLAACCAVLTGCAGIETAVRANAAPGFGGGERTYALAADTHGAAGSHDERYAQAVTRRLAELGYVAAPMQAARYRVVLSYDTHPASVAIGEARCVDAAPCGAPAPLRAPGFPWPGAKTYAHSLTLRFFDRTGGREVYHVSATQRDREPGSLEAVDFLVAGALARMPFAGATRRPADGNGNGDRAAPSEWKITLQASGHDSEPRVTGIAVLPPR